MMNDDERDYEEEAYNRATMRDEAEVTAPKPGTRCECRDQEGHRHFVHCDNDAVRFVTVRVPSEALADPRYPNVPRFLMPQQVPMCQACADYHDAAATTAAERSAK